MKITFLMILFLPICFTVAAQDKPAYKIYTADGKEVKYQKMLKEVTKSDVVFFGEIHNDPICHWLELQVTEDLYKQADSLTIGMEMFEADNQIILDEYLAGTIQEKHLTSEAKVWDNYDTDYKPILDFTKAHQLKVIATNIPRRYASLVYSKGLEGLDSLSDMAKTWIAPLPVEVDLTLPGYQDMIASMGGHGGNSGAENLVKAQAIKDATMAHFILKNKTGKFLHFNGSYHSQNKEGIVWYLQKADPNLKIATIHSLEQENIDKLEEDNKNTADFIICIPADMTKTY